MAEPTNVAIDTDALAAKVATLVKLPENLSGMINDAVEKAIKDRGLLAPQRKDIWDGLNLTPAEQKVALHKAFILGVLKQGCRMPLTPLQEKALSEGTTTAGGYLVADEHKAEVIKRIPELSDLYPFVKKVPVITDAGDFPKLDTDVTITWGRAENVAATETDPVLGQLTYAIVNMSALTYMSRELVADSNPGIVDFVTELFADAIAAERDKKIAIGTNSSQPEGIFSASGVSAISGCSGALTYAKLVTLKYGLKRKYHSNARWVMNSTTLSWVHKLVDSNGMPLIPEALRQGEQALLLGKPFSVQDDIGDGQIAIGDLLRGYYWFDRQLMEIESTTTGGDTFAKHQLAVKVVERCDGGVALAEAIKKSGTFTVPT